MILIYYPDTDTLDVRFRASETTSSEEQVYASEGLDAFASEADETHTYEANPSGETLAHYREGRLEELTIEHASRRAPESWEISALREEAARVAVTTGRIVESVTYDLSRDRTSFQTGDRGPESPYTSDDAVQEYNRMIDEIASASAAAA
jgi:hypothetical protein